MRIHRHTCALIVVFGLLSVTADSARAGGPYDASNVTLRALVRISDFAGEDGSSVGNDLWGYTSPSGRRYGLYGMSNGVGFIEVTDPDNPVIVGYISGNTDTIWRDMKIYQHYAYLVSDGAGVGLQVVDLADIDNGNVSLVTTYNAFTTAHDIVINTESGFAYIIGANVGDGGLGAISLANPENPVLVGDWPGWFSHDAVVTSYTEGPFAGREIAFTFSYGSGMHVVDVTNKLNMFTVATVTYPNVSICHQGWLSEDRQHLFIGDEGDENGVLTTTTYVANVADIENPFYVTSFTNGWQSIDHNMMVRGDFLYEANYSSGLRVWNVSDVNNATEVGYFDTYPENNGVNFSGAWGTYVGFPGSIALLSDRARGLFILDAAAAIGNPPTAAARPLGEDSLATSCTNDADCENAATCAGGKCYAPKNRYVSIDPNPLNAGTATARRVSLDLGGGSTEVLGWIGAPTPLAISGPETATQLIARLVDSSSAHYRDWSVDDLGIAWADATLNLGDCAVSPGRTYLIQAIELGADVADEANYSPSLTLPTVADFGDVVGSTTGSVPDGVRGFKDISAAVRGFQSVQTEPKTWLDLQGGSAAPEVPDFSDISFADIDWAVKGFQGAGYPFADPCTCAGLTPCP